MRTSKAIKPEQVFGAKKGKGLFKEMAKINLESQVSYWSEIWLPTWRMGYLGGKSSIMVSQGVRVTVKVLVCTDWSVLG